MGYLRLFLLKVAVHVQHIISAESNTIVKGPSFISEASICAPNIPFCTLGMDFPHSATIYSYSELAISGDVIPLGKIDTS